MTRRDARLLARRYVVRLLMERETEMPDWAMENGLPAALQDVWRDEIERIAARIERAAADRR